MGTVVEFKKPETPKTIADGLRGRWKGTHKFLAKATVVEIDHFRIVVFLDEQYVFLSAQQGRSMAMYNGNERWPSQLSTVSSRNFKKNQRVLVAVGNTGKDIMQIENIRSLAPMRGQSNWERIKIGMRALLKSN